MNWKVLGPKIAEGARAVIARLEEPALAAQAPLVRDFFTQGRPNAAVSELTAAPDSGAWPLAPATDGPVLRPHSLRAQLSAPDMGFAASALARPFSTEAEAPSRAAPAPAPAASAADANPFLAAVRHHLAAAVERLGLGEDALRALVTPERVLSAGFRVEMTDGTVRELTAFRIQHNSKLGPYKGGIRFAPGVSADMVRALAAEMPNKPAIYGLPLGGGKGGVDIDSRELSKEDRARVMRAYVHAMMDLGTRDDLVFAPHVDVPAPDVGTDSHAIDHATDAYLEWLATHGVEKVGAFVVPAELAGVEPSRDGRATPYLDKYLELFAEKKIPNIGLAATFTGKSLGKGGSEGRVEATGLGVACASLEMLKAAGVLAPNAERFSSEVTVAVHGYGNVGSRAAMSFVALGARIQAIAEHDKKGSYAIRPRDGGTFDAEALDHLEAHKNAHGTLRTAEGVEVIDLDTFWSSDVTILAPCAREGAIDARIAETLIRAPFIAEGANGPTTPEADAILRQRGKVVGPDILFNGAGVLVSYFEMVQCERGERWSLDEVRKKLQAYVGEAFRSVDATRQALGPEATLREAAFGTAARRVASN